VSFSSRRRNDFAGKLIAQNSLFGMKRKIRWLETIELPTLVEATWTDRGKTPKLAKTSFRVFEKGDETPVNVRRDKIHIKRLGALPARFVEGTHFEFIDSN